MHRIGSRTLRALALALLAVALPMAAWSYDPPAGGTLLPILPSPQALSGGLGVTAVDAPWADWLNPAASAAQQRPVLEADYVAISDLGAGSQGWGNAGSLGVSLPTPYAVWGAGLRLISTPSSMTDLPLGTIGQARATIAKDLSPNFYVGAGLGLSLGMNGGTAWGAGLDLGIIHKLGDLGLLKDFRWGAVMSGLGIAYKPPEPSTGLLGHAVTAFPPPYTLGIGARGLLIRTDNLRAGLGLDFTFPSFSDIITDLSGTLSWRDIVGLRVAWGFSADELAAHKNRSLFPSLGLTATIPLQSSGKDSLLAKQGFDRAELRPAVVMAPLYDHLWATGVGATLPLGVVEKNPPKIEAKFPSSSWPATDGAPAGAAYISPNNDGVQDSLDIPIKITDRRYVVGWTFTIFDDKGAVVRKIFNKESRPETEGFKGFWDRLVYVKKGVPVPDKLVWNGFADSGQVVPDGNYTATIEVINDNGIRGSVGPFPVVVKNAPPKAEVAFAENPPIFSPDINSSKTTLLIKMSGSTEDKWTARFLDASGKVVKAAEFANAAPTDLSWDGKGDDGKVVPDGVYSFVLSATDRAGNAVSRRLDNVVVDTQQPPINVVIDLAAFSPVSETKKAETLFPSVPVKTGIVGWRLSVLDKSKHEVWAQNGQDGASIQERVVFDGRDSAGKALPEGQYQAMLSVTYINGYGPKAYSPSFLLDVTAPSGSVTLDRSAFNPAGSSGQNSVRITQTGTKDAKWTGEIIGADGKAARSWAFSPRPDASVEWDGTDDAGKPVADGTYLYRLRALDAAGNAFASSPIPVAVDTEKKAVRLIADQKAFSTLPGSAKNHVGLAAQVVSNDRVKSYELDILAADGTGVRAWKGKAGVPDSFSWDGTNDAKAKTPDGRYTAHLAVSYLNGDSAEATAGPFLLRTVPPSIKISADPLLFSPTEGSRKKEVRITQKSVPGDDWEGRITGPDGAAVRTWTWKGQADDLTWNGSDEAGNLVKDGNYRYEVSSTDVAGNKGSASIPSITVDKRPVQVFVTVSDTGLAPNGDPSKRNVTFGLIVKLTEGIESWRLAIVDKDGKEVSVYSGQGAAIPGRIVWDGRDASGAINQGGYTGLFSVDYLKGDRAEARSAQVTVNTEGPKAEVTLTPELFSPDNSGTNDELTIGLKVTDLSEVADWKFEVFEQAVVEGAAPGTAPSQRSFIAWSGTGTPTKSIVWDGHSDKGELVESATDYPFVFTVHDILGNSAIVNGVISVDVLVIRDGDRLKIKVPSIVFRANFPDFVGLDPDTISRNTKVVQRIAQILNKFKDYRIRIEGHANSVGKIFGYSAARIADEEQKELTPLSLGRAELVRKMLVDNGVDAARLSTAGLGSSEPVVDFKDAQNRWKNRRVEFILIKNQ